MSIVPNHTALTKQESGRRGGLTTKARYGGPAMIARAKAAFDRRFDRYADPRTALSVYMSELSRRHWKKVRAAKRASAPKASTEQTISK